MKKTLLLLLVLLLTGILSVSALASEPAVLAENAEITAFEVENHRLAVTYEGPGAEESACMYVLMDEGERVVLVEMNVGGAWNPTWNKEGRYKVRVYFLNENGWTQYVETDFTDVVFPAPPTPPPTATPEPTPAATQQPVITATAAPLPTAVPAPPPTALPTPQPTAALYEGTHPCQNLHVGMRIRISDNDTHSATKGRSGPGTDMPQVVTLEIGEVYQVLDCRVLDNGNVHWFMVNKNGINCWVASGRCERTN